MEIDKGKHSQGTDEPQEEEEEEGEEEEEEEKEDEEELVDVGAVSNERGGRKRRSGDFQHGSGENARGSKSPRHHRR